MAQRKPYNPNTKYGRRKLREQHAYNCATDPDYKRQADNVAGCVWAVVIIIAILFFILIYNTKGEHAAMKWLRH